MCQQTPYEHIKALIGDRIDEAVHQWNTEGIIYEYDFDLSSVAIENEWEAIVQVLEESGAEIPESTYTAVEVKNDGWMYAGFDPSRYDYKDVHEMIRRKFGQENP